MDQVEKNLLPLEQVRIGLGITNIMFCVSSLVAISLCGHIISAHTSDQHIKYLLTITSSSIVFDNHR